MTNPVRLLNERIARTRVNRRGYRQYSKALRRDIQAHALTRLEEGASYKDLARELGLAAATLQNWCRDATIEAGVPKRPMGFRPVEVTSEGAECINPAPRPQKRESRSGPVLILPNGIRVEGLSVTELRGLLLELGWR